MSVGIGMSQSVLALVVEDDATTRRQRVEMLEQAGFSVISAENFVDATREIRACPLVDLVVTDINLDPSDPSDMSGIRLKNEIAALDPSLPVVGYSAKFRSDSLPSDFPFTYTHRKGASIRVLLSKVEEWRGLAKEHRHRRAERASMRLGRLRAKYGIDRVDFTLLHEFIPQSVDSSKDSIEDVLSRAGYRLRIVESTIGISPAGELPSLKFPVPVWLRTGEGAVIAELYGFPGVYAEGSDEAAAIRQLLLLMNGFRGDLASQGRVSGALSAMRTYFDRVLGAE